jgi:hypothetical protein
MPGNSAGEGAIRFLSPDGPIRDTAQPLESVGNFDFTRSFSNDIPMCLVFSWSGREQDRYCKEPGHWFADSIRLRNVYDSGIRIAVRKRRIYVIQDLVLKMGNSRKDSLAPLFDSATVDTAWTKGMDTLILAIRDRSHSVDSIGLYYKGSPDYGHIGGKVMPGNGARIPKQQLPKQRSGYENTLSLALYSSKGWFRFLDVAVWAR